MNRWAAALVWLLASAVAAPSLAQTSRHERHRVPAEFMSFRGAEWLERESRVDEERPDLVLEAMQLEPGDVVADVGCGSGYYARRIAGQVGPGGTVYCEDIQPEMLEIMKARVESAGRPGPAEIVPVLGTPTDTKLPRGAVDWIFIADVYHEMSEPEAMLASMKEALAPGGRVALLEYRVEDGTGDRIKADHTMSVRQVLREWKAAGFELVALHGFLPTQHLFFFRVGDARRPADVLADYDLLEAVASGAVEMEARGDDESAVTVRLRRRGDRQVVITLPAASYFKSTDQRRDMLARRDSWIVLADDRWHDLTVRSVGRQRDRPAPNGGDRLEVLPPETAPHLAGVLQVMQAGTYSIGDSPTLYPPRTFAMEQAAVWLADDDISYGTLARRLDDSPLPRQYAVAFALVFCDLAGVDVRRRQIWADREQVFAGLRDQGLNVWYQLKTR